MDQHVTVATYNIRSAIGPGEFPDSWWRAVDPARLERLVGVVRDLDADLVGLQEVPLLNRDGRTLDMAREFAERLQMEFRYGAVFAFPLVESKSGIAVGSGLFGNAVLSRRPIVRSRTVGLSPAPDDDLVEAADSGLTFAGVRYADVPIWAREPRCVLICDVGVGQREPLTFASVHLSHIGASQRRRQAEQLAALLADAPGPVVLAGDLNAVIDSEALAPLRGALDDAFAHVGVPAVDERRKSCGDDWYSAIDHILLRGARALTCSVVRAAGAESDHFPVAAAISLEPALPTCGVTSAPPRSSIGRAAGVTQR